MGQVLVQDVDDEVIEAHARRAAANGRSLEDELRELLIRAAGPSKAELLAAMDRCRALTPSTKRIPVADVIRSLRDEA